MKHIKNIKFGGVVSKVSSNKFLDSLYTETSKGLTDNGAVTFERSGSPLLDFYAQAGAMRKTPKQALDLFKKAFSEDEQTAVRILFYLRDVRGGQGERDLFRTCLEWLGLSEPKTFEKILGFVPEYGRWDDLFFDNEKCFTLISEQLEKDKKETPSLLAKWLPTINASSLKTRAKARFIAENLNLKETYYRKLVRDLRKKIKIVETQMSANKWEDINYSHVPSQASRIYKDAFLKHDEERYTKFTEKAVKGEVKINTATLYPYQIYQDISNGSTSETNEALWKQLPDYTRGNNALVVADVSGSMVGQPLAVSVSLALYFAERNVGQFKNHFITFSERPVLQKITGSTLRAKMNSIEKSSWDMNTNLQAVFDLILNKAVESGCSVDELPSTIYIISDMEFDSCCDTHTNFEHIEAKYEKAGYKMPNLVFWNVNASGKNLPVQKNKQGVALVSGFSPVIFKMVTENKTPEQVMLDTINSERYQPIVL